MKQLFSRLFLRPSLRSSLRLSMLITLALLAGCQLTVVNEGGGIVTSKSGEIHCGDQCEAKNKNYPRGYIEELTAEANEGFAFAGWEGDCTGTEICSIEIKGSTARAVRATFTEVELSTDKDITEFSFLAVNNTELSNDATATIDEANTSIFLSLPFGTSPVALIASFITSGETVTINGIEQESSQTPNDFTDPVLYTVTAQDGSEKTYTVTVEIEPSNANFFTDFRFTSAANPELIRDAIGIINPNTRTILAQVPNGTDLSALVASFEINGQQVLLNNVEQVSGETANNFIETLNYQVMAADQSVRNYDVTVTESNCSERRWEGNYTITSQEDIDAIQGYSEISSHLIIGGDSNNPTALTSLEGLECLHTVRSLTISDNPQLEDLKGLDNLTTARGDLIIEDNGTLKNITHLANLTAIEKLNITNNESLLSIEGLENLPVLTDLVLNNLPQVTSISPIANARIHNGIDITALNSLTELSYFSQLENFSGRLTIASNPGLSSLQGLRDIATVSYLKIIGNPNLTSLEGLNITRISHTTTISGNNGLTNFKGLEKLTNLRSTTIRHNNSLINFEGLDSLEEVTGIFSIENNAALTSLEGIENANFYSGLRVRDNQSLTSLKGFNTSVVSIGSIYVGYNDSLTSLEGLEHFTSIRGLEIQSNDALTSLDGLNSLTTIDRIKLNRNLKLTDISALNNLTHIEDYLDIQFSGLTNLQGLNNVTHIADLTISHNGQLQSIQGLNGLTTLGSAEFRYDTSLINLDALSNIETMSGTLYIDSVGVNFNLTGLENLTSIGGSLTLGSVNEENLDVLSKLESVAGNLTLRRSNFTRIDMPQLCTVGQNFTVQRNSELCTANIDALQQQLTSCGGIGGTVLVSDNKQCEQ